VWNWQNIAVHASEGCLCLFQMNIGVSTQNYMTFLSTMHLLWPRSVWLCIRPMWMPWMIRLDVRLQSTIHLCLDTFPTWRYGNKIIAWAVVALSCDCPQFLLGCLWWWERGSTGHSILFSVFTNIYNKKTKGPTLMELFTATGKLEKFFFFDN